jgi:Fe-S-cluster containining protein
MPLIPEIEDNNERPDLCAACGGACCRTRPGIEAPGRFLAAEDAAAALAAALRSRDWLLAEHVGVPWVNGVPPPDEERYRVLRYPRPATVAERAAGTPLPPGGDFADCVFLAEAGCRLPCHARPRMCRSLAPSADGDCVAAWGRREAALAWREHQDVVAAALALLA